MFKKFSDIAIIEGVRNQDVKILNWLYDNYLQIVKRHVLSNSGTPEDVSDVFQDAIIRLYDLIKEDKLEIQGDLKGYFFGIARNIWKDQLLRIGKTSLLNDEISDEDDSDETNDKLLERVVSSAFLKLKPDQQQILNLFSEGKSFDEIAKMMNLASEEYARRKKYICKETLLDIIKEDPEYQEYLRFLK